jgi:fatty-acyl-CoA synthase
MTSGTTGLPKSIGYTHRKYLDSVRLISQAIDFSRPSGTQDVNMLGMPLTGPGSGLVLPTLLSGSALLMPENFHAKTLARLIARHRVTRAFVALGHHRPAGRPRSGAARPVLAAPRALWLGDDARRQGGRSRASLRPDLPAGLRLPGGPAPITWLLPHEHVDAAGEPVALDILASAGRVVDGVEVVIRDDDFQPLPAGQTGLITARTPVAFEGYWKDPERTAETLREGWVVMGDVGYFDRRGYLHVLGRTADRVQRAGSGSTRARWRKWPTATPPSRKPVWCSMASRRCWCSAHAMGSATPWPARSAWRWSVRCSSTWPPHCRRPSNQTACTWWPTFRAAF